jgi:hypothetical protein
MKLASQKPVSVSAQRRNNLQLERQMAVAVRDLYPSVGHVQVTLVFDDNSRRRPSPQSHTFFPAAKAFFRFACPCAECDGDFDLRKSVDVMVADISQGRRPAALSVRGRLSCEGMYLRDRAGGRPCAMTLEYQLAAAPAE